MIVKHIASSNQVRNGARYASQSRAIVHAQQKSVAFSDQLDPSFDDAIANSHLDNVHVKGEASNLEQQNRIEMLKKIKKARDLVFTVNKRRARRTAIGSPEQSRDHVNSLELQEESKMTE